MIPRGCVVVITVVTALAAASVFAGSAVASPESDKLFRTGRDLLKSGRIAEACDAFAASQKLEPRVGTVLNLADCREKQGQTATAWALFLDAATLATVQRDNARADEARRRAAAVKARLSYLTITVAPERQIDGLVIKRNGVAIDRAQWNTAVAIDPGEQVIEASAPGHRSSTVTRSLGVKQRVEVAIEALEAELPPPGRGPVVAGTGGPGGTKSGGTGTGSTGTGGAGQAPGSGPAAETGTATGSTGGAGTGPTGDGGAAGSAQAGASTPSSTAPSPPVRAFGIGLLAGATSEQDALVGARMSLGIAVPHGAVRVLASMLYNSFNDNSDDPSSTTRLFAIGLNAEYVWMPLPQFGFAAGLGLGQDRHVLNLDRESYTTGWWTLRASPVVLRFLNGAVEAGLHLQYVSADDRSVVLFLVGVDFFPI